MPALSNYADDSKHEEEENDMNIGKILSTMYSKDGNSYAIKVLTDVREKGEAGANMSYDVPAAIKRMSLFFEKGSMLLDVGSGVGGPARKLIKKIKCVVTAVEFIEELHSAGMQLSKASDVGDQIKHINGDFMKLDLGSKSFDGLYSILCILHMPDKVKVFQKCNRVLKVGGKLFLDDFMDNPDLLTDIEVEKLKTIVSCDGRKLPSAKGYVELLEKCGFTDIKVVDKTKEFCDFTIERYNDWMKNKENNKKKYGEKTFKGWTEFTETMKMLFKGNLNGCNITAIKKFDV